MTAAGLVLASFLVSLDQTVGRVAGALRGGEHLASGLLGAARESLAGATQASFLFVLVAAAVSVAGAPIMENFRPVLREPPPRTPPALLRERCPRGGRGKGDGTRPPQEWAVLDGRDATARRGTKVTGGRKVGAA